jgi:hypothetical protein
MKIVLNRTGGLSGKTMSAEAEWKQSRKEFEKLLTTIRRKKIPLKDRKADSYTYTLEISGAEDSSTVIDPNKIPAEYHAFFKTMFESLKAKKGK